MTMSRNGCLSFPDSQYYTDSMQKTSQFSRTGMYRSRFGKKQTSRSRPRNEPPAHSDQASPHPHSRHRLRRRRPQPNRIPIPARHNTQYRPRRPLPLPIPSDPPTRRKMVLRHRIRLGRTPDRASNQFNSRRVHATQHLEPPRNQNNDLIPTQKPRSEHPDPCSLLAQRRRESSFFQTNLSSPQM